MQNTTKYYSEFGYYVHQVVALIDKRGDDMFRANLNISLRQFLLLRLFDTTNSTLSSQQIIAEKLGIAKSAVSRHINIAQQNGWIETRQSELSRRQNTIAITPLGKELLSSAKKLIENSELEGFDDIPSEDIEAMIRVLKALHGKLTPHS